MVNSFPEAELSIMKAWIKKPSIKTESTLHQENISEKNQCCPVRGLHVVSAAVFSAFWRSIACFSNGSFR